MEIRQQIIELNTLYLDIEVVSGENQLKQSSLVDLQEVSIPGADVVSPLLLVLVILGEGRVILVVGGPLNHFLQDGRVNVRQRNNLFILDREKDI